MEMTKEGGLLVGIVGGTGSGRESGVLNIKIHF